MSEPIDFVIGRSLRRRRRELDLTLQELGERAGIRFQQIHKYERGINRVSAATLVRLAMALEVDVNYFFAGLIRRDVQRSLLDTTPAEQLVA